MNLRQQSFLLLNHHEIKQRLRHPGTESEKDIRKMLTQARVELEYADTPSDHDMIIVSDNLEQAYKEFVYDPT